MSLTWLMALFVYWKGKTLVPSTLGTQLINPDVEIKMVENTPDDPRQRKPDITKAKELLGWEPKGKLRDGLPLMEDDFRLRLRIAKKN
ncbi:hypothetical protein RIF29_25074 [Crotalaria pallida]|uniref:UDP-glucuronate decarboxylase n=1 Tax=Crotalaria pallida TaxID=3830 RepID=A0AAN9I3V0_CROPI